MFGIEFGGKLRDVCVSLQPLKRTHCQLQSTAEKNIALLLHTVSNFHNDIRQTRHSTSRFDAGAVVPKESTAAVAVWSHMTCSSDHCQPFSSNATGLWTGMARCSSCTLCCYQKVQTHHPFVCEKYVKNFMLLTIFHLFFLYGERLHGFTWSESWAVRPWRIGWH